MFKTDVLDASPPFPGGHHRELRKFGIVENDEMLRLIERQSPCFTVFRDIADHPIRSAVSSR
jgi:hypothetical protein